MAGFRTLGSGGDVTIVAGDTDILWEDSFDLTDQLAGTLGPIQTQDSVDLTDAFVAKDMFHVDSFDMADDFNTISGLVYNDSLDIADQLAGTLGPIIAPDTLDIGDEFVADAVTLPDSFDTDDVITGTSLTPTADDSIDISDEMNQTVTLDVFSDTLDAADAFAAVTLTPDDSIDLSDQFDTISGLTFGDGFDTDDLINATTITTDNYLDTVDIADQLPESTLTADESLDVGDAIAPDTITLTEYGNAVISSSNITNPNNITGNTTSTSAFAESIGSITAPPAAVNFSIVVDFSDIDIADLFTTYSSVNMVVEWSVELVGAPVLPSGDFDCDYSNNDGTGYSNLDNHSFTAAVTKGTSTHALGTLLDTQTEFNGSRVRFAGTVDGGTALLSAGMRVRFYRVWLEATVT